MVWLFFPTAASPGCPAVTCRSGGIGRRAWFRSMCPQGRGGSSPFFGTTISKTRITSGLSYVAGGKSIAPVKDEGNATRISEAVELFAKHVKAHSPAKPRTLERYREALAHFERLLGHRNTQRPSLELTLMTTRLPRAMRPSTRKSGRSRRPRSISKETCSARSSITWCRSEGSS